jgi:hypothetical protein
LWASAVRAAAGWRHVDMCAAVRASDEVAKNACAGAGVRAVEVADYAVSPGLRHNYEGVAAKRARLVAEAVSGAHTHVWFVDSDVIITCAIWSHAERLARAGCQVLAVPCGVRWAGGVPLMVLADGKICDIGQIPLPPGDTVRIRVAGMGCTLIATPVAEQTPFVVGEVRTLENIIRGEDIGWFLGAEKAEPRALVGFAAIHMAGPLPPRCRVLVAAPFTADTTSEQVAAWRASAQREADKGAATDTLVFSICAVVGPGTPAPKIAVPGVHVVVVEQDPGPPKSVAARASAQIIGRIRLARQASEMKADIVWFLDLNIRPPRGGWDAMREEIVQGAGAALIPYPLTTLGDGIVISSLNTNKHGAAPGVVVVGRDEAGVSVFEMVDPWTRAAEAGRASFPAVGGGFGCTAIPICTLLVVKFSAASIDVKVAGPGNSAENRVFAGEASGWYLNALRAKVPVRAISGAVCTAVP